MSRPLHEIVLAAERVAGVDLSSRLVAAGEDEVGSLKAAIGTMAETLETTISDVRHAAATMLEQSTALVSSALQVGHSSERCHRGGTRGRAGTGLRGGCRRNAQTRGADGEVDALDRRDDHGYPGRCRGSRRTDGAWRCPSRRGCHPGRSRGPGHRQDRCQHARSHRRRRQHFGGNQRAERRQPDDCPRRRTDCPDGRGQPFGRTRHRARGTGVARPREAARPGAWPPAAPT